MTALALVVNPEPATDPDEEGLDLYLAIRAEANHLIASTLLGAASASA